MPLAYSGPAFDKYRADGGWMHGRPSDSVLTNAAMTGGTAIRPSFRANGSPLMSVRFAGRGSHRTNRQNTVPEHVSTHQDDHNHKRRRAAFFIATSYW